jgi:hypothetical protein
MAEHETRHPGTVCVSSGLITADKFYASSDSLYQGDRLGSKFDRVCRSESLGGSESFKLLKRFTATRQVGRRWNQLVSTMSTQDCPFHFKLGGSA